jgi:GNAT superfamily N-acetyltransferase
MLELRVLEKSDIPEVVEGWNQSLIYDQVTQERFGKIILDDPNYEQAGNVVALDQGKIVGFVSAVAPGGIANDDGKGRPLEQDSGHIKGLFVLNEYWDADVGAKLLDRAEKYVNSKGKSSIKVVVYLGGRYFFPGIDLRYERLLDLFADNGYERLRDWGEIDVIDDLSVNLTNFEPTAYHIDARRRVAKVGVIIAEYHSSMLEKMRTFAAELKYWHWFPEGWEQEFGERGYNLVALKEEAIVGWASYWPQYRAFGPVGVLETYRGNGIGTCLLLESMLRMKALGVPEMIAGWAETDFYLRNGWEICRQYAPFQKALRPEDS